MNRVQPVHRFIQVAETVRGRILNNVYVAGSLIPTARELEEEFQVSNITIRKALDLLTREGYLIPRRGVGTFVAEKHPQLVEIEITGTFQDWVDSAAGRLHAAGRLQHLQTRVLETGLVPCPDRILEILSIPPEEKVWRMRRVRLLRDEPISYFMNYAPHLLGRRIDQEAVKEKSLVEVFQAVADVKLFRMEQTVRAVVADIDLSKILNVAFGDPLFFVENIYSTEDGRAMEVTHMYYRGDRYAYKALIEL